jgi:crotonobetainyl-CoA:carnitine CoA-transferase CaiB-like acyl-CoA transferase
MMMADMGAEVIKVETPQGGDELRNLFKFPGRRADTEDYFGMYNRNKRSLAVDLKSPEGKDILWALVKKSDIFVQNLGPGAVDRLGFDWDSIRAVNEKMVYVNISGFGIGDSRRAYDGVAQAASGMMDMTGQADGPPALCGTAIGDVEAALFSAFAAVGALRMAERTGKGAQIDVAMVDCLLAIQSGVAAEYLAIKQGGSRLGAQSPHRVPHNIYQTSDGSYIFLVSNNEMWPRLCHGLDVSWAADDPRFRTNQDRVVHRAEVNELLGSKIGDLTREEVCGRLEAADVPHSAVQSFAEVIESERAARREMVITIEGELRGGREAIRVMGSPYKMSEAPPLVRLGPPVLGEANSYVIHELLGL